MVREEQVDAAARVRLRGPLEPEVEEVLLRAEEEDVQVVEPVPGQAVFEVEEEALGGLYLVLASRPRVTPSVREKFRSRIQAVAESLESAYFWTKVATLRWSSA